jgi:hypothetical protein
MSLQPFLSKFRLTEDIGNGLPDQVIQDIVDSEFTECINELGGKTFEYGLYRVFRGDQLAAATGSMAKAFPELAKRLVVFGYDWLGRHFAIDQGRRKDGRPLVLLLEPGAGEAQQIPVPITEFHNEELVNYANEALAAKFYESWRALDNAPIQADKCVGYKVPLFLKGKDDIQNLELVDLDVYVEICGQLRNKVRELPAGTTIRSINIKK